MRKFYIWLLNFFFEEKIDEKILNLVFLKGFFEQKFFWVKFRKFHWENFKFFLKCFLRKNFMNLENFIEQILNLYEIFSQKSFKNQFSQWNLLNLTQTKVWNNALPSESYLKSPHPTTRSWIWRDRHNISKNKRLVT